jgi:hypothetical protein
MLRASIGLFFALSFGLAQAESILFVGNSITYHPSSRSIGWDGDWGMAATSRQSDYVNLTVAKVNESSRSIVIFHSINVSAFERDPSSDNLMEVSKRIEVSGADRVVIFLGDNVKPDAIAWAQFLVGYESIVVQTRKSGRRVVCVSLWWPSVARNRELERICKRSGGVFAMLPAGVQSPDARASGHANKGVASHPGDVGMRLIANAVSAALEQTNQK